jgi:hypothetical protein
MLVEHCSFSEGQGSVMKRWMAGVVTVLVAVGGLAVSGTARASSGAWYPTYQVNTPGIFYNIAALSKANIWAVGDFFDKKDNPTFRPLIRHYADGGWKTVTIPGSPKFQPAEVSASAGNDVWVFGLSDSSPVAGSMAYRFDGAHWHKIPVPAETFLQGAVALGPRNVWAYGSSGTVSPPGGDSSASIFHWNGSSWRGYNLDNGNLLPESISASAANNVWIAGAVWTGASKQALAYRWNGTGWHKAAMPRVLTDGPGVTALSPSNVWVGWYTETAARVTHWDGHHWHTFTTPSALFAETTNVVPDGKGGYWFGFGAILTGSTWTSEPAIESSGALGSLVRIPGTESFLLPASVENANSAIQKPTLYRFDL